MRKYSEIFAENLHRLRRQMKMTQEQLANKICYTEKAVSKWESGSSVPPAETLISLAEIFNVSIDELFNYSTHPTYFLGIDGGGTKTTFALADKDGKILTKTVLGPSNPFDIGFDGCMEVLSEGINLVTANIHKRKITLFAGIAGCGSRETRERIKTFVSNFGFLSADVDTDAQNIMAVGLGSDDGAIVIMGTGSSCIVRVEGKVERIGGLGYLFDHGGSGYDLGNAAIVASCKYEDGRGEYTSLADKLRAHLKVDNLTENLRTFYNMGKSGVASLSSLVIEAYDEGDGVAKDIIEANSAHIAELGYAAIKKLRARGISSPRIVFAGGLTSRWDVFGEKITEKLSALVGDESYELFVYEGDVVEGALLLAGAPKPNTDTV